MSQPIPAASIDLRMHLWYLAGLGDQVIRLELNFDQHLDEEVLARATELLLHPMPVLASRLEIDLDPPQWLPLVALPSVLTVTDDLAGYEAHRRRRLDASAGPQIAICLWRQGRDDRLLLEVTHQVADGGGVKDIAQRLADLYTHVAAAPAYEPPPAPQGSRDLGQVLHHVPKLASLRLLFDVLKLKLALRLPPALSRSSPIAPGDETAYVVRGAAGEPSLDPGRVRTGTGGHPERPLPQRFLPSAVRRRLAGPESIAACDHGGPAALVPA